MDQTVKQQASRSWIDSLDRSEAQLAAGQIVSGEAMHQRLRDSIARLEARLSSPAKPKAR